jgi:hypothetical protein
MAEHFKVNGDSRFEHEPAASTAPGRDRRRKVQVV